MKNKIKKSELKKFSELWYTEIKPRTLECLKDIDFLIRLDNEKDENTKLKMRNALDKKRTKDWKAIRYINNMIIGIEFDFKDSTATITNLLCRLWGVYNHLTVHGYYAHVNKKCKESYNYKKLLPFLEKGMGFLRSCKK